jgi:hypothetical protein
MGAELIERVEQCEAMTRDALAVTEELKETDARYREEAKRVFLAGDGGGPQDLFRAEGKDRRAGHDRH